MEQYLSLVDRVISRGDLSKERTGVGMYVITGEKFEHEMANGFPLITTKRVAYRAVKTELEGFIKGITDKKWYQERKCHIWDEWCNPEKVHYNTDEKTKEKMFLERDLGAIYGFQWRHFGAKYEGHDKDYTGQGFDQLALLVKRIKEDPHSRRQVLSAWNPLDLERMAIEPCHFAMQTTVRDKTLDLVWYQRSVDVMLGLPFNIASYATLLHLLAKETGYQEGKLTGLLGNVHIYKNHREGAAEQLKRNPRNLPLVESPTFTSIFEWTANQTKARGYNPHPKIEFPIAV